MRKKLIKMGTDGLSIYFTKNEIELYGLIVGDVIEINDMLLQKKRKSFRSLSYNKQNRNNQK